MFLNSKVSVFLHYKCWVFLWLFGLLMKPYVLIRELLSEVFFLNINQNFPLQLVCWYSFLPFGRTWNTSFYVRVLDIKNSYHVSSLCFVFFYPRLSMTSDFPHETVFKIQLFNLWGTWNPKQESNRHLLVYRLTVTEPHRPGKSYHFWWLIHLTYLPFTSPIK